MSLREATTKRTRQPSRRWSRGAAFDEEYLRAQNEALSNFRQVVNIDGFEILMLLSHDLEEAAVDLDDVFEDVVVHRVGNRRKDHSGSYDDDSDGSSKRQKKPQKKSPPLSTLSSKPAPPEFLARGSNGPGPEQRPSPKLQPRLPPPPVQQQQQQHRHQHQLPPPTPPPPPPPPSQRPPEQPEPARVVSAIFRPDASRVDYFKKTTAYHAYIASWTWQQKQQQKVQNYAPVPSNPHVIKSETPSMMRFG